MAGLMPFIPLLAAGLGAGASWFGGQQANEAAGARQGEANLFNLYQSQIAQANANQQADISRGYAHDEAGLARQFLGDQGQVARDFNAAEAEKARSFSSSQGEWTRAYNSWEAQKARDFGQMMSSTAYQRAMQDMKAAGLNPMLAYQQGGANTPSAGQASSAAIGGPSASVGAVGGAQANAPMGQTIQTAAAHAAPVRNVLEGVVPSALAMLKAKPELEVLEQEVENRKYEGDRIAKDTRRLVLQGNVMEEQAKNVAADTRIKLRDAKKADIEAGSMDSPFQQRMMQLGFGIKQAEPFFNTAESISRLFRGGR